MMLRLLLLVMMLVVRFSLVGWLAGWYSPNALQLLMRILHSNNVFNFVGRVGRCVYNTKEEKQIQFEQRKCCLFLCLISELLGVVDADDSFSHFVLIIYCKNCFLFCQKKIALPNLSMKQRSLVVIIFYRLIGRNFQGIWLYLLGSLV